MSKTILGKKFCGATFTAMHCRCTNRTATAAISRAAGVSTTVTMVPGNDENATNFLCAFSKPVTSAELRNVANAHFELLARSVTTTSVDHHTPND